MPRAGSDPAARRLRLGTMTDTLTLTGVVATAPRSVTTGSGLSITSFRLASTQRRFDRSGDKWVDGDTNWYTISTFRQLAANTLASVNLGERVVVTGRVKVRAWQAGDKSGTSIEVDAEAVGHDLSWGFSKYTKGAAPAPQQHENQGPSSDADFTSEPVRVAPVSADPAESWSVSPLGSGDPTPF